MCKSFTCLLSCACVEATRKTINPQALSQFLSMLECVLISSLRQVISETHGILSTQLPCYRQMEDKMLAVSSSGTLPALFSPRSKELLASPAQMTVSAEALISSSSCVQGLPFPTQLLRCWEGEKWRLAPASPTQKVDFFALLQRC